MFHRQCHGWPGFTNLCVKCRLAGYSAQTAQEVIAVSDRHLPDCILNSFLHIRLSHHLTVIVPMLTPVSAMGT